MSPWWRVQMQVTWKRRIALVILTLPALAVFMWDATHEFWREFTYEWRAK